MVVEPAHRLASNAVAVTAPWSCQSIQGIPAQTHDHASASLADDTRARGRGYDPRVSNECLFCRIVAGEIPAVVVVHETPTTLAFRDVDPKAPVHVLVITKAHHADIAALNRDDPALAGELLAATSAVAAAESVDTGGYRLILNVGADGGQSVPHVHAHVLGGTALGWRPAG